MQYCANCGAPVEGRFCAKCGAPVVAGADSPGAPATEATAHPPFGGPRPEPPLGSVPPPAYIPSNSTASLGLDENLAAALCYIPIIGLIFLLVPPYSDNRTIRFHAWQSLLLMVGLIVVRIALLIVRIFLFFLHLGAVWSLLGHLAEIGFLLALVFGAIKAYQRERLLLPLVGPIAERQA